MLDQRLILRDLRHLGRRREGDRVDSEYFVRIDCRLTAYSYGAFGVFSVFRSTE